MLPEQLELFCGPKVCFLREAAQIAAHFVIHAVAEIKLVNALSRFCDDQKAAAIQQSCYGAVTNL